MTSDISLTTADREESLSRVYVYAVASFVGYTISKENYDRNGIDLRIHAGGLMEPSIGLQLKATIRLGEPRQDGNYRYAVPIRDYQRLIRPSQTPKYLVVLSLPENEEEWLSISADELVLRRCAYWLSLQDMEESQNSESVTVSIPGSNRFDAYALRELIERSRQDLLSALGKE